MNEPEVVIYGASGYTGKLIAWHLAELGIPFIAAGRSQKRLEEQMSEVPELEGARYECVACDLDRAKLVELFSGKKVVYNIVGPFMQLSEPVVQACLEAGAHYMDTTGEQDWMLMLKDRYGKQFADKDLLLCPANAWMWTAGDIAAEIALETPGIDSLDLVYLADSYTSIASTMSFLRMCCGDQHYLASNQLEVWPYTTSYDVSIPGEHEIFSSLPWGGGGEPTWFLEDERVQNCKVRVAFRNREIMQWVVGRIQEWHDTLRDLSREKQEEVTNEWGRGMVNVEPPREIRELNRSVLSCHGRGNSQGTSVVLRGNSPYIQASVWAAESVRRILTGQLRNVGYSSPSKAFGYRELLAATAERDYLTWEKRSI